jgi:hypothetical protein
MELAVALLVIGVFIGLWAANLRAREQVLARCRHACRDMGVQLLDETVRLARLGMGRDHQGRMRFKRWYAFEFSVTGADRRSGAAILLGRQIECLRLELPDGPVIME